MFSEFIVYKHILFLFAKRSYLNCTCLSLSAGFVTLQNLRTFYETRYSCNIYLIIANAQNLRMKQQSHIADFFLKHKLKNKHQWYTLFDFHS